MSASSSFPPSLRRNLGVDKESEGSGKELGRRGMIGTERIGLDAGDSLGALGLNLESTGPGVFDALFSSFSMILVTEIGDETFIIAALMGYATPQSYCFVWCTFSFVCYDLLSDPFTRQESFLIGKLDKGHKIEPKPRLSLHMKHGLRVTLTKRCSA
ncbi:hypothetical protein F2Q69_00008609 [Brassica cretica]|uniref:GDT1 family protein n=1 Tax=Brassica cretica TaxID=69181 RepID=A0A8S9NSD6_BRACR|nr:hypothetical protein F2Q69_00008609 [Brassica cretica]